MEMLWRHIDACPPPFPWRISGTALVPAQPDEWPKLRTNRASGVPAVSGGLARPDDSLTRGELAQMLYTLLDTGNQAVSYRSPFSDTAGKDSAQAIAYLASYGILTGYADGTFRPDAPVSRAAFAVLLHRCQFAAPVGQYGEAFAFEDVPAGYWAETYIYSAKVLGWLQGSADGGSTRSAKSPEPKGSQPSTGCWDGMNP